MNTKPLAIIITGLPCSGKTTIGYSISAKLKLPFFNKDLIKESLFDSLGVGNREWSRKLSLASNNLLLLLLERELAVGRSCITESNFPPKLYEPEIVHLVNKYDVQICQIFCHASQQVLAVRAKQRVTTQERHPGHLDEILLSEQQLMSDDIKMRALCLNAPVIELDTSDFTAIDYDRLLTDINSSMT